MYVFIQTITKIILIETILYLFSLKKVFNKLPLLCKAILEKDLILITINIITLKIIRQISDLT